MGGPTSDMGGKLTEKRKTYLIQDPYDLDALEFIRTIGVYFGLRPICLYTDKKSRFYGEQQFPILCSDEIEESFDVSLDDLASFCADITTRYDILGVIPYREDTVEVAAELCEHLELDWIDGETLSRFRDKFELKRHVTDKDAGVRVPECRLVRKLSDVWDGPDIDRFVIKPNNGFGNQAIGIFHSHETDAIAAHINKDASTIWILEEFIGGVEYHVNGQVRRDGEITVLAVFEYFRTTVNNYPTVYSGERQIRTSHPRFDELTDYARRLLKATGLRGSPFHMEVKVDDRGPCVVDLGARFASDGGARIYSRLHPYRPDAYSVAAHDYLGDNSFGKGPVDFAHYDSEATVIVFGISERRERIETLNGLDEVEALPEFVAWIVKPRIGDQVVRTKDLRGAPYIAEFRHFGDDDASERLIDQIHETVIWNQSSGTLPKAKAAFEGAKQGAVPKLRWIAHRSGERLRP